MSGYLGRLISDDFVWDAIARHLPSRQRRSGTSFLNIDCPMCSDRKMRCGIKQSGNSIGVSCFNCHFVTAWNRGETLSPNMRRFLSALGMDDRAIAQLNHKALSIRRVIESSPAAQEIIPLSAQQMSFPPMSLPPGSATIVEWANRGCDDPNFVAVADYMLGRGDVIADMADRLYWAPSGQNGMERRLIVPFLHEGKVVGWSARTVDPENKRKYDSRNPSNYLFNNHVLSMRARKYVVLVEGVFDALAIDGVATLGAKINAVQISWLKSFGKTIIVCPDRDKAGRALVNTAIEHGWRVAFPVTGTEQWWDADVKDAADAVKRYGRLYVMRSIIESAVAEPAKIEALRNAIYH